jgi:hypothetical protein
MEAKHGNFGSLCVPGCITKSGSLFWLFGGKSGG